MRAAGINYQKYSRQNIDSKNAPEGRCTVVTKVSHVF